MSKISVEERKHYYNKVKPYQSFINSILSREEDTLNVIGDKTEGTSLKNLTLAEDMTNLTSNYLIMNNISEAMLKIRNGAALNEGRKSIYKAVIYLEKVVSSLIDAPFSEYEEKLNEIIDVDAQRRYGIIKKTGLAIQLLENAFGMNSKWKWAFVELEGRYAAVAKNIIDLKTAVANTDPRSPDYEPTVRHLRLSKKLLLHAADNYRRKYESSTKNPDDLFMAIQFLDSLKRVHIVLGDRREVELVKKKTDLWRMRLERSPDPKSEETLKIIEQG